MLIMIFYHQREHIFLRKVEKKMSNIEKNFDMIEFWRKKVDWES